MSHVNGTQNGSEETDPTRESGGKVIIPDRMEQTENAATTDNDSEINGVDQEAST